MGNKKILISLPEALLSEVDSLSSEENMSRSKWIRNSIAGSIKKRRRERRDEALREGYLAMGDLNVRLAEESVIADNEQLLTYELKLSESE